MAAMQRFLSREALQQARAVRNMLVGVPGPPCSHLQRLSPAAHPRPQHHRWLSTSDSSSKAGPRTKDEPHRPSFTTRRPEDGSHHSSRSTPGSFPEAAGKPHRDGREVPPQDTSVGLYQRFKKTFQQYGKVMIPVHIVTSSVWVGTFYYAAMKGVNVVPFLEFIGLPDSILNLLRHSSSGYLLTAWALYKITTPVRYIVTMGGTKLIVQYLRRRGYMSKPPSVKEYFKERREKKSRE